MNFFERIWRSNFSIKLRHWEYWPFGILQFPVFIYYLWLSLRARSFFFFSASNPGIEMGGMLGESKFLILQKIPTVYTAKTIFIQRASTFPDVLAKMNNAGLSFPVIFKPDLGERGYGVKRIDTKEQARQYIESFRFDFLVQQFVDFPLEFGVFYKHIPGQKHGSIFSIVGKEMLSVTGDGSSTLQQLILKNDRAKLQWGKLKVVHFEKLNTVIEPEKKVLLNSIGNHCLGTKFLNNNKLINDRLNETFTIISHQIEGFCYGRFDLRCATLEDLYQGNIKIMELNGCGAEPAHIYQPGYSFWRALVEMFNHWRNIFVIAVENKKRGVRFLTFPEAKAYYKKFNEAIQP